MVVEASKGKAFAEGEAQTDEALYETARTMEKQVEDLGHLFETRLAALDEREAQIEPREQQLRLNEYRYKQYQA